MIKRGFGGNQKLITRGYSGADSTWRDIVTFTVELDNLTEFEVEG